MPAAIFIEKDGTLVANAALDAAIAAALELLEVGTGSRRVAA